MELICKDLDVGYVSCPLEKRVQLLFTFLKKNTDKKLLVVFNSNSSAQYHQELFSHLGLEVTFDEKFVKVKKLASTGPTQKTATTILISNQLFTQNKSLNLSIFDWVILYEPINEIGTCLSQNVHKLFIVLQPSEKSFLDYLKKSFQITCKQLNYSWSKITHIQLQVEKLVSESYALNTSAKQAYKDYLRAYNKLELKDIFNIKKLDIKKLCLTFGFKVPVAVDLTDESAVRVKRKGLDGYGYYNELKKVKKSEYRRVEEERTFKVFKPIKNVKKRRKY